MAFTVVALVCHRELAERRPPAAALTRFYLWVSVGGALGGLFNALIAPQIFTQIVEYPLVLAVAALISPRPVARQSREPAILLWGLAAARSDRDSSSAPLGIGLTPTVNLAALLVAVSLCAGFGLAFANRRGPFAVAIAASSSRTSCCRTSSPAASFYAARSFFGVHRVSATPPGCIGFFTARRCTAGSRLTLVTAASRPAITIAQARSGNSSRRSTSVRMPLR